MKKVIAVLIIILFGFSSVLAQELNKPELLGTWIYGEDWLEFMYSRMSKVEYYLKEQRDGKLVARICSKDKFPEAFITSTGFAYTLDRDYMAFFDIPIEKVDFAVSSNCAGNSKKAFEEYWYVPENQEIEYEEKISAGKVFVKRFLVSDYDKKSEEIKKEFAGNIADFVQILKDNPTAKGFIIKFSKKKSHKEKLKKVMQRLKEEKIDLDRIKFTENQRIYKSYYPEMITVLIK
ncbi:hypothetical protein BH20ACI1_BH20ACI1_29410 [soil metagenome]